MILTKGIVPVDAYINTIATVQATEKGSLAAQAGILKSLCLIHCLDLKLSKIEMF